VATSYTIVYAPEVLAHVAAIDQKYHRLIERTIAEQLRHSAGQATRNRKPIEDLPGPFGSTWELRFGPDNRLRAFYDIHGREVWILAIGVKDRSRLFVAGEEIAR
jgi:hypothetical protein